MADQFSMQDPRKQYPEMDIPEQRQEEPGLDRDLKPSADHGFATYKGFGRLSGRHALITGGDSGIGRAVAVAFAREGAQVAINYLPSEQVDAEVVAAEIEKAGGAPLLLPGDVSDETFCTQLVDDAHRQLGGLDIVVNNAGKQLSVTSLDQLDSKQLEDTFRVNVFGMVWITKRALKYLQPGATIINTTSIQAYQPSPDKVDYAMTKAAVANFTKSMAAQLADKGIRVNAVAPGPIWTPLQPSDGQQLERLVDFGKDTPLGRAGQPAELASVYIFLASQESSYITGEIIGVTGGKPIT